MSNKVYVGNLPYSFVDDDLRSLFAAFGPVRKVEVVLDRETNRSRGFGFVEMETAEAVQAVIQNLHDTELQGRRLSVNEARERVGGAGGPARFGSGPRFGGHPAGHSGGNPGRHAGGAGAPPPRPGFAGPSSNAAGSRADFAGGPRGRSNADLGGSERESGSYRSSPRGEDSSPRGGDGHRGRARPKRNGEGRWSDGGGRRRRRDDDFGDE